jgi:tRNA(Glu) U13 pseudouridine synthase TruD
LEYEFIKHNDADEDLTTENYNVEIHPKGNGDNYNSIRLTFQLPQSTYATMLFRELSKVSSDIKYQAELSEKNKGENNNNNK